MTRDADEGQAQARSFEDRIRSLEDELARIRQATRAARMVTWVIESTTRSISFAPTPFDSFGLALPADVAGMVAEIHSGDRPRLEAAFARSVELGEPIDQEYRLAPLGAAAMWVRSRGRWEGGRLVGVTQDISDKKAAEQQQQRMAAGLQHRMKNILAVVRSISARTLETADSMDGYATHFSGRLDAMARTQGVLARAPEGVELEDLVRDELATFMASDAEAVDVRGPRILLKDRAVEVVAMALHELTTNAVKYGALSRPEGRVIIDWHLSDDADRSRLLLSWQERGVPALNPRPTRVGFGRDLLERGLPYDLGAVTALVFSPGGARFTAALPLGDRVVAVDPAHDDGTGDAL